MSVMLDLSMLQFADQTMESGVYLMITTAILTHDIRVDDAVWDRLVLEKHAGRFRSVNDFLRYHLEIDTDRKYGSIVKNYADQSLNEGVLIDEKQ